MADNFTTKDASENTITAASDEIAGVKIPRFKLIHGDDGVNDGDVSSANPLPVTLGSGKNIRSVTGTVSADTDIVAAVTGKRIKVTRISLLTSSTTAVTVTMQSNAATALSTYPLQAISGGVSGIAEATGSSDFLFGTVQGEKLTLDVSAAQSVTYNVSYFADDAT